MAEFNSVRDYLLGLQQNICTALEGHEPKQGFVHDDWQRTSTDRLSGSGRSRVLENGELLERAGVNFSDVSGTSLPPAATNKRPELAGRSFHALGVSLVIHPLNPHVPTVHLNVRFFSAEKVGADPVWWFGGGFDLTPYYGYAEDAQHWHQTAHDICQPFGEDVYPRCKAACDEYFFIRHRQEPRGIGGLFFDDLDEDGFERSFAFMQAVGDGFLQAYLPIVERRKNQSYSAAERDWQLYRRGRYVEFNLVQDRGTLFGLQSGGRTESILMSMPPLVNWTYRREPEPGSAEARLYEEFLQPRDWLNC